MMLIESLLLNRLLTWARGPSHVNVIFPSQGLAIFKMMQFSKCGLGLSTSILKLGSAHSSGVVLGRIPSPLSVGSIGGFEAYARLMVWICIRLSFVECHGFQDFR